MATTWTVDACAATTGTAEPARIDPAALSARIAGTMRAFLMRTIPPCCLHWSAVCCMASPARNSTSESCITIAAFRLFHTQRKASLTVFSNTK
jgi:hypothetical protein